MKNNISFDDYNHTFIIAEAGSNWKAGSYDEDLNRAKKLIETASAMGADAIKFQTFRTETVYVSGAGKSDYLVKSGIDQDIGEIIRKLSMPYEMIPQLYEYSKEKNLLFMSSAFSVEDAKQVDPYVKIHKIASFEINHVRLLEFLADTKKPILISTGASTFEEIEFAINLIKKRGNNKIGIMQCTSKYPAPIDSMNLSVIPSIKSKFGYPVGFSDHSISPLIAPLMAVGLGATFIEKHFTLDKSLNGPDHAFALNPEELGLMINAIREADKAKGSGKKEILPEEIELRNYATRSLQAIEDISKGDELIEGKNFDVLRSGNRLRGLDPRFLTIVNGKKAKKDIKKGDGITEYE